MSLIDVIDEVMFRKLLLEEFRTLNSNLARLVYTVEMIFPAPPQQSYSRTPEETVIEFANEGPEVDKESEEDGKPPRTKEGIVEAAGSDAY